MPVRPRKNESKNDFIQRCVGKETDSGRDPDQAVAICYDIWKRKNTSVKH